MSLLFTASWKLLLVTFLTGLVVDWMLAGSGRRRVPPFFQQLAAAATITLIAAGVTFAGARGIPFFVGVDSTLVVVGGIVMLVAGMMIVGAVQDAIDQFYVTASARVFGVFMRTAGIVAGICASGVASVFAIVAVCARAVAIARSTTMRGCVKPVAMPRRALAMFWR